jgi:hypothetical protein
MSESKDNESTSSDSDENLKFMAWTSYLEDLISGWADNALSYSWLNLQSEAKYRNLNYMFTIPIVVLSTIVGTINVGMSSLFPQNLVQYGQIGVGAIGIFTGILGTLQNFFKYAQLSEAHRSCAIHWHKFYRQLKTELALEALCRKPAGEFFRSAKAEMDRLLDSSPYIPSDIIKKYLDKHDNVELPEIIGNLRTTSVYRGGLRMSPKNSGYSSPSNSAVPQFIKVIGEK